MTDLFPQSLITELVTKILALANTQQPIIVAIDGFSGSGKTTLAKHIMNGLDCNVFHTDDFFTSKLEQKKSDGRNPLRFFNFLDMENQIHKNITSGDDFTCRFFDCSSQSYGKNVLVKHKHINIIEGCYATCRALKHYYSLAVFVKTDYSTQIARISKRNGAVLTDCFISTWIPSEKQFFEENNTEKNCDIVIKT